jgi:hypothetical protein
MNPRFQMENRGFETVNFRQWKTIAAEHNAAAGRTQVDCSVYSLRHIFSGLS